MGTKSSNYIKKHQKYIDYRINSLSSYILECSSKNSESIEVEKVISMLIAPTLDVKNIPSKIENTITELRSLLLRWSIEKDGDIVGYIYQNLDKLAHKKTKGQYFTPDAIVKDIVEQTIPDNIDLDKIKILDPACGSGQFLIYAFKRLLELHAKKGTSMKDASRQIVKKNLFGADLDNLAVKIAIYNLKKIACLSSDTKINIFLTNTLLLDEMSFEDKSIISKLKYDYIIGNPPWGSKLNSQQKSYFRKHYNCAKSGINTFTLFIERSLSLLKEKGKLGFLIPEAYLNIKAHRNSRIDVLQQTKIHEIKSWGDQFKKVYAPSISIIMELTDSAKQKKENVINIKNSKAAEKNISSLVPQNYFHNTFENIFNINYSRKAVNIINRIDDQNCCYLNNNAKFFLGIVTGNNPKHITQEITNEHPDKIVIGKDLSPYKINYSGNYFKYSKDLQQVAPKTIYKTKNKILYKFIGKKLSFALDKEGYYTLNNVNGFIPEFDEYTPEALVAILNSSVMQYYYEKNFFTLKVLKGNLEKLPLKNMQSSIKSKLTNLSLQAMHADTEHEIKECKDNIDDLLFYEYGLQDKEAYALWEETNTTKNQSIIPGF